MNRDKLIDFLYDNNVHSDISIESLADDILSIYEKDKIGKWIILEKPGIHKWRIKCSKCHKVLFIGDTRLWAYCPYCGSKMERKPDEHI